MAPSRSTVHQFMVASKLGGAGRIAVQLAGEVRARGLSSRGWVPGPGPAAEALATRGVPWSTFAGENLQAGGARQVAALLGIAAKLVASGQRRGVVHVHHPMLYGLLSPMLARLGAPTVAHFHIDPTREDVLWSLQRPPSAVVTCSAHIGRLVSGYLADAGRTVPVIPIPNAIDLDRYTPGDRAAARRQVGAPETGVLVLMLANLSEHKGQLTAVRATRHLLDRGVAVHCWLAGEERDPAGPFTARLRAEIAALGLGAHVALLGSRSDADQLLRAADVFVLPSSHEGLPLSLLEAQAAGVPVVASPIPGNAEVIRDGATGFLVDRDDTAAYADRIAQLVTDRSLRDAMVQAALAQVRSTSSWKGYANRTCGLYQDVAAGHLAP